LHITSYKFARGGGTWIPNIGWEGREVWPEAEKKYSDLGIFVANWVVEQLLMILL